MSVTDDIRKTLIDPKPLYALAGVGDLAASTLRDAPTLLTEVAGTVTTLAGRISTEAPLQFAKVQARIAEVPTALMVDPRSVVSNLDPRTARASFLGAVGKADPQVLRDRVQSLALIQVGRVLEAAGKAVETYDELAERGKTVVERYRSTGEAPAADVTVVVEQVVVDEAEDAPAPKAPTAKPSASAAAGSARSRTAAAKAEPKIEDAVVADAPAAAKPQAKKTASTPRKRTAAPKSTKA